MHAANQPSEKCPNQLGLALATIATFVGLLAVCYVLGTARSRIADSKTKSTVGAQQQLGIASHSQDDDVPSATDSEAGSEQVSTKRVDSVVGRSVKGRPIPCVCLGNGESTIVIMASIHGNEAAGTPLLRRLIDVIMDRPEFLGERRLVVLPIVNPDGMAANSRYNARGVDLNRNFPASNRQASARYGLEALSEPEALAIHQTLEAFSPDHIVTLHEPLQCIDFDGPGDELAKAMSEVCPLPVKKLGSRPGSLGAFAGETLGIPIITLELPRNAARQSPELLWQFYGPALLKAVRFSTRN